MFAEISILLKIPNVKDIKNKISELKITPFLFKVFYRSMVPCGGLEPPTPWLRVRCSDHWANKAKTNFYNINFRTL
jgi:hypothetical protein